MKEGIDMSQNFQHVDVTTDIEEFMLSVESNITDSIYTMRLTDNSRKISDFITGFIAHESKRITKDCCEYLSISSEDYSNQTYLHELSQGGLTIPSQSLRECVAQAFSILDESSSLIRRSKVPSRKAGKHILIRFLDDCNVACAQDQEAVLKNVISTVTNIFFNNQRKRKTETVVKDRVAAFKKCKCDK